MRTKLLMAPMFDKVCVVQTTSLRQARFPALAKNFGVLGVRLASLSIGQAPAHCIAARLLGRSVAHAED